MLTKDLEALRRVPSNSEKGPGVRDKHHVVQKNEPFPLPTPFYRCLLVWVFFQLENFEGLRQ